jgi:Flp pilus assembly protein TadD
MKQQARPMRAALNPRARPGISRNVVVAAKKKGFGAGRGSGGGGGGGDAAAKPSGRARQQQPQPTGLAAREDIMVRRVEALEEAAARRPEDDDFEARLATLRAAGKAKKAAAVAASPLASASADAFAPLPGPLDPMPGSTSGGGGLYDSPAPPLSQTLLGGVVGATASSSTISDPALRDAAIGPGKGLLAAGAIALALVLFFVTGAEVAGPSRRYQGLRVATDGAPTGAQALALERQADELEAKLAAAQVAAAPPPFAGGEGGSGASSSGSTSRSTSSGASASNKEADLETLEALAVTRAQLFEFDKAEPLLARLTAAKPDDPEAWRLLGEVRLLAKDEPGAVTAYAKASALRPDDLKIATGLADAYIANGQQGKAADFVIGLRKDLAAGKIRGGGGAEAEAAAATAAEGDGNAAPPYRRLDDVSARLLLGKSYAAWRGHDGDAFAAYDDLIEAYPEDFRGYLAKGVLLKQRGRQSDGERLLLQARYYAPTEELKAYVAARSGAAVKEAATEVPPDNNS